MAPSNSSNPDLLNPQSAASQVAPLAAITKPMDNTKVEPVWFYSTMATANFHRYDGKKLPFMANLFKCTIKEDIAYLDEQIDKYENPYLRRATEDEVGKARMNENPIETIRAAVRQEVEDSFSIEELQKLIERRKQGSQEIKRMQDDGKKIAGEGAPKHAPILQAKGSGLVAATTESLGGANGNIKTSNSLPS